MDRFLSNWTHNIDSKGRVSVPAPFRQILAARGFRDLFAMQAIGRPVIDVGGPDLLERYERQMDAIDPFGEEFQDLALFAFGDGMYLKFDAEGRITVNDFIRSHTGIGDQIVFVGAGDHFQLWEPSQFEAHRAQARARLLASRSARGASQRPPE